MIFVILVAVNFFGKSTNIIMGSGIRGYGDTKWMLITQILGTIEVVAVSALFVFVFKFGILGVFIAVLYDEALRAVITLIFNNGKILCIENPLWENGKNVWKENVFLAKDLSVQQKNSGYTTRKMLCVLDEVINNLKPKALFLNIGTNDLNNASVPLETVIFNFRKIVKNANNKLQILAKEMGLSFIDLNSAISDENGNLRPEFSVEGMHVNEAGYEAISLYYSLFQKEFKDFYH